MPSRKIGLSCYIRTLNEERLIATVVAAAMKVADEVVIVDSGSTDRTVDIATELGARVVHQPWLGNGKQKRVGEDACQHGWLLDLDADEVLTDELIAEINRLFSGDGPSQSLYKVPLVLVPPHGKPWYNFARSYRIKLYDRRYVRMPDHAAWDQISPPEDAASGKLDAPILHYSFPSIEHMVMKMNRVSTARLKGKRLLSLPVVILRIVFGFPVYFFKNYILRGMIRGGVNGFSIAAILAFGRWLRDVKMYEQHAKQNAAVTPDMPKP